MPFQGDVARYRDELLRLIDAGVPLRSASPGRAGLALGPTRMPSRAEMCGEREVSGALTPHLGRAVPRSVLRRGYTPRSAHISTEPCRDVC